MRAQAFSARTIRAGFRDRRIWPWNALIVLDELEKRVFEPDLPGSGVVAAQRMVIHLHGHHLSQLGRRIRLNGTGITSLRRNLNPMLGGQFQRIFRGSPMQEKLNAQGEAELEGYLAAVKRRNQPRKQAGAGAWHRWSCTGQRSPIPN